MSGRDKPEPDMPHPDIQEPDMPQPDMQEPDMPEPDMPQPGMQEPDWNSLHRTDGACPHRPQLWRSTTEVHAINPVPIHPSRREFPCMARWSYSPIVPTKALY